MIKLRLRHATLGLAIATTTASLLLNIHGIIHADLRPTIVSNTALVVAAASWLAIAVLSIRTHIAARLDILRIAAKVHASQSEPGRPDRLHLVAAAAPRSRQRRRLSAATGPALLGISVAILVTLGMLVPRSPGADALAPPQLPATTTSTVTVTVTQLAQAQATEQPAPGRRTAPPPASSATPTATSSPNAAAATSTATPSVKKTKTRTAVPPTTPSSQTGPPTTPTAPTTAPQASAEAQTPPTARTKPTHPNPNNTIERR